MFCQIHIERRILVLPWPRMDERHILRNVPLVHTNRMGVGGGNKTDVSRWPPRILGKQCTDQEPMDSQILLGTFDVHGNLKESTVVDQCISVQTLPGCRQLQGEDLHQCRLLWHGDEERAVRAGHPGLPQGPGQHQGPQAAGRDCVCGGGRGYQRLIVAPGLVKKPESLSLDHVSNVGQRAGNGLGRSALFGNLWFIVTVSVPVPPFACCSKRNIF